MSGGHAHGTGRCRELVERLSEYLDGELDPGMCAEVEEHLGGCPPCEAFLESLRRTVALLRRMPDPPMPEEVRRHLVSIVAARAASPEDEEENR
jgi:RNA polymerase sigma-70 factor (ECF subfamily)